VKAGVCGRESSHLVERVRSESTVVVDIDKKVCAGNRINAETHEKKSKGGKPCEAGKKGCSAGRPIKKRENGQDSRMRRRKKTWSSPHYAGKRERRAPRI